MTIWNLERSSGVDGFIVGAGWYPAGSGVEAGRAFVRPSGTEDVVRVYAEAQLRPQADGKISVYHCASLVADRSVSQNLLIV